MADAQEAALAERAAEKLETHGEIDAVAAGESAREAQTADAGKIRGDGEDLSLIHI